MNARPKILYLTTYDLDGPDNGGTLRNRHILRHLSKIGDVNVLLASDFAFDFDKTTKKIIGGFPVVDIIQFQRMGKLSLYERMLNQFDPHFLNFDWTRVRNGDRDHLLHQCAAHDLVWIHTLRVANRFDRWRWPATVLDIDDVPSSQCRNSIAAAETLFGKLRLWRQTALWRRRERFLLDRFEALCVCSDADKKLLGDDNRIFVLPNGFEVPIKTMERKSAVPPRIGFVGNFRHPPNDDGLRWFAQKIWPEILRRQPGARLRLAGAEGEKFSGIPNVDILGWIADMENEMASWNLSIVPIRIGAGTRVKIAESFGRKCPVVSTALGAYGYDVTNGLELWLADSPRDFAAKCLRALENPSEAEAMAARAYKKFLRHWTWNALEERVETVVESVLKKREAWRNISRKNFESLQRSRTVLAQKQL
ncbi:MAG TPA: glycosyltransferase family 4 protein [Verrucomicrobiae bacterium]|nr:glycosyltransferase family 4 protein [Verrucomicrobiae bacterium]